MRFLAFVTLACLLALASADNRRHKPRVNYKGDSVGHSNYGRSFDERKKCVACF
jgi:hypothetical protein